MNNIINPSINNMGISKQNIIINVGKFGIDLYGKQRYIYIKYY